MNVLPHNILPRLPLDGYLDLTFRCNNTCRHCWLWVHPERALARDELSTTEIVRIVDNARSMGCQAWHISGGEPMLRPDFAEIFDYITRKSIYYSLNTNGTRITPAIAQLMARKGNKMVALYGATAEVHDDVTRNPGSFEATMRGFAYLREAGAGFTVQIVPMRANYHQYEEMLALARSLSPQYRVGSAWLFYSACGSAARNREIEAQRLPPSAVLDLDQPNPAINLAQSRDNGDPVTAYSCCDRALEDDRLFASCIVGRRDFHIDPYGQMSFCCFIKDPNLRYDLRIGSFKQAWEQFIPSLAEVVHGGQEYQENCGTCELRADCRWCAVYGYLEHGRYSAKVEYLCDIARENHRYKGNWKANQLRYYQIAGVTVQETADFPFSEDTFVQSIEDFRVQEPGDDVISIHLAVGIPELTDLKLGNKVYQNPPWMIFEQMRSWAYLGMPPDALGGKPYPLAIFSKDYATGTIFRDIQVYTQGKLGSLTTFASDQVLLASVLANRQACYLHAGGITIDDKGFLFVGHSEAGKSTILKLLRHYGEILCDDRIIVRRWPEGFRIHGTWSHGELPDVSPHDAPLKAVFLQDKAPTNELIAIESQQERLGVVLSHVVKPLITADWWEKTLDLAGKLTSEVPFYRLRFDKSGQVINLLKQL
ncbi:MAG: radical SAM protein [Anaerolineae bacterium]